MVDLKEFHFMYFSKRKFMTFERVAYAWAQQHTAHLHQFKYNF